MTQKSNFTQPKLAFVELSIQLMLSEVLEDQSQVYLMICFVLRVHQDIIDLNYHELIQEIPKHAVHEIHECSRGIGQPERQYKELIMPVTCTERRFRNILGFDSQLMISGPEVNLRENCCSF